MLKELVDYAEWLKKDFFELFESGIINEGLHIKVELNKSGSVDKKEYEFFTEDKIPTKFILEMAKIESESEMIPIYIVKNKYVDSSAKFITSNNCFSLFFYLFKDKDNNLKISKAFEFKNKNSNEISRDKIDDFINNHKLFKKINQHFKNLKEINNCNICNNCSECNCPIRKYIDSDKFRNDLKEIFKEVFIESKNGKKFLKHKEKIKDLMVYFILEINDSFAVNKEDQIKNYFIRRLPLKDDKKDRGRIRDYVFSPILNQDNAAKIFSRHKTAFSEKNIWIKAEDGKEIIKLLKLLYEQKLPNPLPIFIDKKELNKKVITLFKKDESKRTYKDIIKTLAYDYGEDLNNYYLLYYQKGKSLIINDIDFVSSFKFYLNSIYKIMNLGIFKKFDIHNELSNIFDIEDTLDNNFLFKVNRKFGYQSGILKNNYFTGKIDPGKGNEIPGFILNNLYKYRKTLYDAIYKSRLYLITPQMIKEFCEPVIYWEILHDETNEKGYSKNEYRIIKKLLYYFVLNKIFDKENKNTGGIDMPSKLPEYYKNLKELLGETFDLSNTEKITFKSDEDFAFGLGQLIRYLLELSESSNKNHSMLVPFLQKLNNYDLFMRQLEITCRTYCHKIKMNYYMFDRLMANVMSYKPEKTLQDLEMIILSGYFADSMIKKILDEIGKNKDSDNKEENNE